MIELKEFTDELLKTKYNQFNNDDIMGQINRTAFSNGVKEGYNAIADKIVKIIKETPNDMDLGDKIRNLKFY
jgi:hypothetical protein